MRFLLIAASVLAAVVIAFLGLRLWQFSRLWPRVSTEVVQLTPEKRAMLQRLRAEIKFLPNDYPPLGYTGAATPEDQARATAAVNGVIDAVLAQSDGLIHAKAVSDLIGSGMKAVNTLETEDRDRTGGYMVEVWYLVGFKGATGRFAYGSAYPKPQGYGEPLPPGWAAPDKPRPID
jgi:hypothetical protein